MHLKIKFPKLHVPVKEKQVIFQQLAHRDHKLSYNSLQQTRVTSVHV